MITLIITVLFGLGFAYLATQNTSLVTVKISNYVWTIPLYMLSLGSLLVGLLISGVINLLERFSSWIAISNREGKIKESAKTIEELNDKIYHLEIENAKLRQDGKEEIIQEHVVETPAKPKNVLDRIRILVP